jgi:hypothetical protein
MKPQHYIISAVYFVLSITGSWYYAAYSSREITPYESQKAFKENVLQAKKGMNAKQVEEYNKIAGLAETKNFN